MAFPEEFPFSCHLLSCPILWMYLIAFVFFKLILFPMSVDHVSSLRNSTLKEICCIALFACLVEGKNTTWKREQDILTLSWG